MEVQIFVGQCGQRGLMRDARVAGEIVRITFYPFPVGGPGNLMRHASDEKLGRSARPPREPFDKVGVAKTPRMDTVSRRSSATQSRQLVLRQSWGSRGKFLVRNQDIIGHRIMWSIVSSSWSSCSFRGPRAAVGGIGRGGSVTESSDERPLDDPS